MENIFLVKIQTNLYIKAEVTFLYKNLFFFARLYCIYNYSSLLAHDCLLIELWDVGVVS